MRKPKYKYKSIHNPTAEGIQKYIDKGYKVTSDNKHITVMEYTGVTLHLVDSEPKQRTVEVTEKLKNELVDLDLAWFDGKDWCVMDCEELKEVLKANKIKLK
jgi:hypothetical protein